MHRLDLDVFYWEFSRSDVVSLFVRLIQARERGERERGTTSKSRKSRLTTLHAVPKLRTMSRTTKLGGSDCRFGENYKVFVDCGNLPCPKWMQSTY